MDRPFAALNARVRAWFSAPCAVLVVAATAWSLAASGAHAQTTFYWDTDTSTAGNNVDGTGLGGSGNWNTSTANWWDLTNLVAWPNLNTNTAVFTGPEGIGTSTVTLSSGIIANRLRFQRSGYILTGGDLTLAGTGAGLFANFAESATINSQISGSDGLTMTGGGTIRLGNSANNYTGTTTINNGTLVISNGGALGTDASAVVVNGSATRAFGGGTLFLDGSAGGFNLSRNLTLQGLGPISDRSAALLSYGSNQVSGAISSAAGLVNTRILSNYGTLTMSGGLDVGGTAVTTITTLGGVNQAGIGTYSITGPLTGTGILEKSGSGTLLLNPSDSSGFSGTIRLSASATGTQSTVRITDPNVLGTRTATTTNSLLDINGGTLEVRMDSPSLLAGGAPANVYHRATTSTIFVDHAIGSFVVGGTATFGQLAFEENLTLNITSRNGYNVTFGAAPVQGGTNNSTITNSVAGLLTFTGAFWSNTDNGASRSMTIGGNGNSLISGNVTASAAAFDHVLTKSGSGSLTISSVGSTLDGDVNIQGGAIRITDFRSITNNTGTIRLGNATTTAGHLIIGGTGVAPTLAGLTTSKTIELNTTTASNSIYANQTGVNPVVLNGPITKIAGATTGSLILGGTNTLDNIVNSSIPSTGTGGLIKLGPGTWVLAGSNAYTGATTIQEGTLKLRATAGASDVIKEAGTNTVVFSADAITQTAGGTLQFTGFLSTATTETLGALTPTTGAARIITTANGGATTLTFTSLGTRGAGAYVDYAPGASTNIAFTGLPTVTNGILGAASTSAFQTYHGVDWATLSGSNVAQFNAYTALPVSFSGTGGATVNYLQTANAATTGTASINTLKMVGSGSNPTFTLGGVLTLSARAILFDNSAGIGTITGSQLGANATEVHVITNGSTPGNALTINSLIGGTTGSFTKSGTGTVIVGGNNTFTGNVNINEGIVRLSGATATLGVNSTAANITAVRQGATLDINAAGASQTIHVGALAGAGIITNSGGGTNAAGTISFGRSTSTGTTVFSGIMQDGDGVLNVTVDGTTARTQAFIGLNTYSGVTTIGTGAQLTVDVLANGGVASGIGASSSAAGNLVFAGSTAGLIYRGNIRDGSLNLGSASAQTDRLFTLAGTGATISSTATNGNAIIWSNTGNIAHAVTGPQTLIFAGTSTGDNLFNPRITDSGTGANITSVNKIDAGVWHLGNTNNTYTGTTTITAGILGATNATLSANSPLVFGGGLLHSSGDFTRNLVGTVTPGNANEVNFTAGGGFSANDGKLVVAIGGTGSPTALTWGSGGFLPSGNLILNSTIGLNEVEFRNAIDLNSATRTVQVDDNTTTATDFATLSGVISGTGSITKSGTGILQLLGANTYNGNTNVTAGTLIVTSLGNTSSPGASSVGDTTAANTDASAVVLGNVTTTGGILQYIGAGETSNRKIRLQGTTASNQIHADGTGALILTNVAHDTAATGSKTLFLRGSSPYGNMITSGLTDNGVGNLLGVTVDGAATWILSGNSSYTGLTTVSAGALGIGSDTALGNGTFQLGNGNVFAYGADRTLANAVTQTNSVVAGFLGDYSLILSQITYTGTNTFGLNNNIASGKSLTFAGLSATSVSANRTWTVDGAGTTIVAGDITTGTTNGLIITKTGDGLLELQGAGSDFNKNNANIDIDRGTIRLGANNVIPDGSGFGNLTFTPEAATSDVATFDLNGFSETVNGITATTDGLARIINSAVGTASLTFGANDQAVNFIGEVSDAGAGALSITKIGTAAAVLSQGPYNYSGATTVSGGSLTISGEVDGTTSLNVINSGSVLALTGGMASPSAVTNVVVENGALLSLLDGVGTRLDSLNVLQLGSASGTMTTLNLNVGDTTTAGNNLNTDLLRLLTGGTLNLFAGNQITFNLTDAGLNANQTYTLIDVADGGLTSGPLSAVDYILGGTPGGFSSFTLTATNNTVVVQTGNLITGDWYWNANGTLDNWNDAANWADAKDGLVARVSAPGQGSDVKFIADNILGGAAITTTLEQNFKINSLTFEASTVGTNTPSSVTINPGAVSTNRLEVAPQSDTDGVKILAGGPANVTIAAPFKLGANQTWTVADAASTLTFSGGLQGDANLIKTGDGRVVVSAVADTTYNTAGNATVTINAGNFEIGHAMALGSTVIGNDADIIVNGGAFYYNNATAGTVAYGMQLNGGTLSAGGAAQTYSGAINISGNSFVNMRDSNSATLTTTQRNITLSGQLSGNGSLTVDSINTVVEGNQETGTLTLSNNNSGWSGGLNMVRGTVTATNVNALGTGNINGAGGRIIFNTAGGTTFNLNNITLDSPSAVLELNLDASGTPVADMNVNVNGVITLGSAANANMGLRVTQATDNFSILNINGGVVLGNHGSISYAGSTTRPLVISSIISETGGARNLSLNDDLGGWAQTNQTIRLEAANTYSGSTLIGGGIVDFSTVTNIGGAASNLGQGNAINVGAGTLRFIGNSDQSTDRALTISGAATFNASGTGGAKITYNSALDLTGDLAITLDGTGLGVLGGGPMTISGAVPVNTAAADLTKNGTGVWELNAASIFILDDVVINAGILRVTADNVFGTAAGNNNVSGADDMTIAAAGILDMQANAIIDAVTINGGQITGSGAAGVNALTITSITATTANSVVSGNLNLTTGRTFAVAAAADLVTVSGFISGAGGITKTGLGTVHLTNNNTYTGTTLVRGGTVLLDAPGGNTLDSTGTSALAFDGTRGQLLMRSNETVSLLTLTNGTGIITLDPSAGQQSQLTVTGGITRAATAPSALFVRGENMGGTGPDSTRVLLGVNPTLVGGGGAGGSQTISIVPFIIGGTSATDSGSTFVTTYADGGNFGLRPLANSEYVSFSGNVGSTSSRFNNVSFDGNTNINGNFTVNAARLMGGTHTIGANNTLTIGSGAVLMNGANTLNGGVLDFGTQQAVLNVGANTDTMGTINSRIRTTGGLLATSTGDAVNTVVLGGDNLIAGTVLVANTLRMGSTTAMNKYRAANVTVGVNGSSLQLAGLDVRIGNLTAASGSGLVENAAATAGTARAYNYGNSTFSGIIQNGTGGGVLNLVKEGSGTLSFNVGNSTYTGSTTIQQGQITVSGNAGNLSGTTALVVNGSGVFNLANTSGTSNVTNRLNNAATVLLSAGRYQMDTNQSAGENYAETVGALTIGIGQSVVRGEIAATGQTQVLTFASLDRVNGGIVNFTNIENAANQIIGVDTRLRTVFTTAPTLTNGILPWAMVTLNHATAGTVGSVDFATNGANGITAFAGYDTGLPGTWTNTTVASRAGADTTLAGNTDVYALKLAQSGATALNIGAGNTLNIHGGSLIYNSATAGASGTISNGTLTAGGTSASQLIVYVDDNSSTTQNTAGLVINSTISDNSGGAVSLVKGGSDVLTLGGTNNYTGSTSLFDGTLTITSDANLGTAPSSFTAGHLKLYGSPNFSSTTTASITNFNFANTAATTLNANRGIELGGGAVTMTASATEANTLTYNGHITSTQVTNLTVNGNWQMNLMDNVLIGGQLQVTGINAVSPSSITLNGTDNFIGGGLLVGRDGNQANLTYITSGGELSVGMNRPGAENLDIGVRTNNVATTTFGLVDLAGSALLNAYVDNIRLGVVTSATGAGTAEGDLNVGMDSDIYANTQILVGLGTTAANNTTVTSDLMFGSGIHSIITPNFIVGDSRASGHVGIDAGGLLNLEGIALGTGNLTVGRHNIAAGDTSVGVFNMTGATFTANLNQLVIAQKTSASTLGAATGTVTVGNSSSNLVNVNSVLIGSREGGTSGDITGTLNFNGGVFNVLGDATLGNVANSAGASGTTQGTWNIGGGTATVQGILSLGQLVDGGTSTSAGTVNLNGGTLRFGTLSRGAGSGTVNLGNAVLGGLLDADSVNTNVIVSVNHANSTFNTATGRTTTFQANAGFSGSGSLTKTGAGTLALAGNSTVTGTTTLQDGTVNLTGGTYRFGTLSQGGTGVLNVGDATLGGLVDANSVNTNMTVTLTDANSRFDTPVGFTTTFQSGAGFGGTGSLTKTGAGTLVLEGNNAIGGSVTLQAGTLRFADGTTNTSGNIIIDAGLFEIFGDYQVTGDATINAGSLVIGATGEYTGTGLVQVKSGATLDVAGILDAAGGVLVEDGGNFLLSGTNNSSGNITVESGSSQISGTYNVSGSISVDDTGDLTVTNTGSITTSAGVSVQGAGTLNVLGTLTNTASGTAANNGSITVAGTYNNTGGTTLTGSSLSIANGANYNEGGSVTVGGGSTLAVNGTLDSTGGVFVNDGGVLSGSGTIVDDVTLNSGSIASPGNSPGSMDINGNFVWNSNTPANEPIQLFEINNVNTVNGQGTAWDYWNVQGTLTINSVSNNTITIDIDSYVLDSMIDGDLGDAGFNPLTSYSWLWVTAAGGITVNGGTLGDIFTFNTDDLVGFNSSLGSFQVLAGGGNTSLSIVYTAVPEPGSWALCGLAAAGLGAYGWRRRRARLAAVPPPSATANG